MSDISLTIASTTYTPSKCADNVNNGNPTQETANLNTTLGTSGFVYLDTSSSASSPTGINGITFVVSAPQTNNGTWTVTWADSNGSTPYNLPIMLDLEIGLFGGNNGSDYLLTGVTLPASPTSGSGTFDINFLNGGGQQPNLSHMTLTGGNAVQVNGGHQGVPEPASLAVLGIGLLGLGAMRRRINS